MSTWVYDSASASNIRHPALTDPVINARADAERGDVVTEAETMLPPSTMSSRPPCAPNDNAVLPDGRAALPVMVAVTTALSVTCALASVVTESIVPSANSIDVAVFAFTLTPRPRIDDPNSPHSL
eukprot:1360444-Rhodomonas_salina.1